MTLSPALSREVDRRTHDDQMRAISGDVSQDELERIDRKVHRELELAKQAQVIADELGKLAMGTGTADYLTVALSTEHRTILGQVIAAVAKAVVATVEPDGYCKGTPSQPGFGILHRPHDGRLTCATVIGATLAQHQPTI